MEWIFILGTVLAGLGLGATIGAIALLTYKLILNFKRKKDSVVVTAQLQEIMKGMLNNPKVNRKNLKDLANHEGIIAECDPTTGNVDQIKMVKRFDDQVRYDLISGGVCIYE